MEVTLFQEGDANAYKDFINNADGAKIYHTLEWKEIIEETYGYTPYYLLGKEGASIKAVLPLFEVKSLIFGNRLVSLPFSHRVNLLYDGDQGTLEKLICSATGLARERGALYVEIKHGLSLPSEEGLSRIEPFFNSVLDLSVGLENIWKGFESGSVRWGIKRAQKEGVRIEKGNTLEDYLVFYNMELETRKAQGSPPYPFRFFKKLKERLGDTDRIQLYLAYLNRICIAGIIVLCHQRRAIYGYSASLKKTEYLRMQPTNLLLWTAIQELYEKGYTEFDFGTTHPCNQGLLRFKSRWGTDTYKLPYYYILNKAKETPGINREGKCVRLANGILRRMPVFLLKRVGPLLLRHVG